MVKVDLIAGFLGAGKTTFLLQYARSFMDRGQRIGLLLYDYGSVNVDMLLLHELRGDLCELEMVAAGCDADCLRRRFKTKLIAMAMSGYERVIIEPSGVFDMDLFFDSLREEPLDNWYEIGSVLTVVNARLSDDLSKEEDFILASQAASAGKVIFSRVQLATGAEIQRTRAHLLSAAQMLHCTINSENFVIQDWAELTKEQWEAFGEAGYHVSDYVKLSGGQDFGFESKCYLHHNLSLEEVKDTLPLLFENKQYGNILRVKGFVTGQGESYQINASAYEFIAEPTRNAQDALLVIGTGLNGPLLDKLMKTEGIL